MKTRRATIDDSPALARIQVDSYRTAYAAYFPQSYLDHFTYEEETQDWQGLLSSETDALLLVAGNDVGKVVGYALGRRNTDESNPFDGTLAAMYVWQNDQRLGFEGALVAAMAEALHE